jgi:hypothetical protein
MAPWRNQANTTKARANQNRARQDFLLSIRKSFGKNARRLSAAKNGSLPKLWTLTKFLLMAKPPKVKKAWEKKEKAARSRFVLRVKVVNLVAVSAVAVLAIAKVAAEIAVAIVAAVVAKERDRAKVPRILCR